MPGIKVKVEHSLSQNIAQERIKKIFDKLKDDFSDKISDVQENWSGNSADFSFKIMGLLMKGVLRVDDDEVILDGKIPFTALPFKGLIESKIKEEAENLLKP